MLGFKQFIDEDTPKPTRPSFMGSTVYVVDHSTYTCCIKGKKHGDRWIKYIEDETLRDTIKKDYWKQKSIILQSSLNGSMVFLRKPK